MPSARRVEVSPEGEKELRSVSSDMLIKLKDSVHNLGKLMSSKLC